jgi:hypothetical protein
MQTHRATEGLRPESRAARLLDDPGPDNTALVKELETRPINQSQLVAEVKGIYACLVKVESTCIEEDNAKLSDTSHKLNNEQWQSHIALHRTLLYEHHDFFLASQHPAASPALRHLALKYAMPARLWRHGIHCPLELLRRQLLASLEPMLTFIYLAYSMMALLYETVPTLRDIWIECLGDISRYRQVPSNPTLSLILTLIVSMAVEVYDIKTREIWAVNARHWYSKASDMAPTTGRLYHHLAILAQPNAMQQLFYYTKSLCVPIPFLSTKESIQTLFGPLLASDPPKPVSVEEAYVRIHAILFSNKLLGKLQPSINEFLSSLDEHIGHKERWMESR